MTSSAPGLNFRLSNGVLNTISPPIPSAQKWASEYIPTPSRPLIDMSQGVPSTPPHPLLQNALGKAALLPDAFGYCPVEGEVGLREAFVDEMKSVYGEDADIGKDDLVVTSGCNLAFVAAVMCVAGVGDEVVLPVPWYFNHQMTLSLLGIKTVQLETFSTEGFLPSIERCKSLITPKTRAIALVTPNNPTGATYPPSLISSFFSLANSHNIALVIDETYRDFITSPNPPHTLFSPSPPSPSPPTSSASSPRTQPSPSPTQPPWRQTLISLYSFSKSYRIPSHRLGLLTSSPHLLPHLKTILDTLQICAPRVPQLALGTVTPGLLGSLRGDIEETREVLRRRHVVFRRGLPRGWDVGTGGEGGEGEGGYFAYVRHPFGSKPGDGGSESVCRKLVSECGVLALPASFFRPSASASASGGGESASASASASWEAQGEREEEGQGDVDEWIRFSVANVDDEKVVEVCERLRGWEPVF